MLRALPLVLWIAEVLGGVSRSTSASRLLLTRRISVFDDAAKESSQLIPGLVESMPEAVRKVYHKAGLEPPLITKNHQGYHHVCQPWEDCDAQEHEYEEEVINASKVKAAGTQNVTEHGALELPPRKCPGWGATQRGCECLDSCECAELSGPSYALVHRCKTRLIKSEVDGSETPCGEPEFAGSGDWYDTCLVHTTPFPRPKLRIQEPAYEHPANKSIWRNFNAYKNKRFLPKSGCYGRDSYCASFPMFTGCDPTKTYTHLVSHHLTAEQQAVREKCKKLTDQKTCEEQEECGKGKHGTCHSSCVWTEDAPMWFREMRGRANMKIKKSREDPARVQDGEMLPVLQPGPGQSGGQFGTKNLGKTDASEDTVIKKSDKREKAGSHLTTPPPKQVLAGTVGTQRSEGWLSPSEVGKNVGNDNTAVGKFRPQR